MTVALAHGKLSVTCPAYTGPRTVTYGAGTVAVQMYLHCMHQGGFICKMCNITIYFYNIKMKTLGTYIQNS